MVRLLRRRRRRRPSLLRCALVFALLFSGCPTTLTAEAVRVDSAGCALSTGCYFAADVFERPYGSARPMWLSPRCCQAWKLAWSRVFATLLIGLTPLYASSPSVDWPRGVPNTPFEVRFCGLVSLSSVQNDSTKKSRLNRRCAVHRRAKLSHAFQRVQHRRCTSAAAPRSLRSRR